MLRAVTWWDTESLIANSDTRWVGGTWLPREGALKKYKDWIRASGTHSVYTEFSPVCVANQQIPDCLYLEERFHLFYQQPETKRDAVGELTFISIPGVSRENVSQNSTPRPRVGCLVCKIHQGTASDVRNLYWSPSRSDVPPSQQTNDLLSGDWGPRTLTHKFFKSNELQGSNKRTFELV